MASTEPPVSLSPWAPLRDVRFRATWGAFLAAQVVIWAETVGAVDVITDQSSSAALVALIQTAISLPGVVLALFAGAVAATPGVVLVLTAALGAGLAMFLPAFSATVPALVSRAMLAPAIAITNVSVNLARAAGPAFAGVLIAVTGAGGLFWALAGVLVVVVVLLMAFGPPSSAPERPERIGEAMRAGARYARFSAPLRAIIART